MISLVEGKITYNYNQCQQCGACYAICPKSAIELESLENGLCNIWINNEKCILCKRCINVCPSRRKTSDYYFETLSTKRYYLASNTDPDIRKNSSSGGVCKTLIIESLNKSIVNAVYSLRKLDTYPSAEGEFFSQSNIPDYNEIPNSVYHSIMACKELRKVEKTDTLMLIGTSCQLYALEKSLKGRFNNLIKVCIFCKQQKSLDCTYWLAKLMRVKLPEKNSIKTQYRGGGWPGTLRIMNGAIKWEKAAALPFGRRLWCVPGCDLCGDPFGIETDADVTLMDPWGVCSSNELGDTLVIVHTEKGRQLIENTPSLTSKKVTFDECRKALGLIDVWRKRQLIPYFENKPISDMVKKAGDSEMKQRSFFERILVSLPRMPFVFYRVLNKLVPIKRNHILKNNQYEC